MEPLILSRIQFAMTSMFHYIYPPLSIGIGLLLVFFEGAYVRTRNPIYKVIARFWVKIFALTFALGVATGLVQVFGFGTNWSRYSRFVGDVFGSALGAEGIFAFFLESGFLGLMLFGWDRVSAKIHYLSTICVAIGAHFSAFWIVIANSWMQTPTGYKIVVEAGETRAVVTDFWAMILNPSAIERLTHVILGCWLSGIFLFLSINAYYLLKKRYLPIARVSIKSGLIAAVVVLFLQLLSADDTARGVRQNQPAKFAAMEGVYQSGKNAPLTVIGWVDEQEQRVKGVQIPGALSLLSGHSVDTEIVGFDQIPQDERPPVQVVFQAYHVMIWMWGLMFLSATVALFLLYRKKLEKAKWWLRILVSSVLFPQIANQVGWMTAEIGRQPWIVHGLLRTADGLSKSIKGDQVFGSLVMLFVIYTLLLILFLFLLDRKIKHGPEEVGSDLAEIYHDPYKNSSKRGVV